VAGSSQVRGVGHKLFRGCTEVLRLPEWPEFLRNESILQVALCLEPGKTDLMPDTRQSAHAYGCMDQSLQRVDAASLGYLEYLWSHTHAVSVFVS
jgi:hypothetical protein